MDGDAIVVRQGSVTAIAQQGAGQAAGLIGNHSVAPTGLGGIY
jgi:hypothetical protein